MGEGLKRARAAAKATRPPRGIPAMLRRAGFTRAQIARCTTHAVKDGNLNQLDLPVHPAYLAAVRTVHANWPRITDDWLIAHEMPVFRVDVPSDVQPGTVVEWADTRDDSYDGRYYTVIVALGAKSASFLHVGQGTASALEAARSGNRLRDYLAKEADR